MADSPVLAVRSTGYPVALALSIFLVQVALGTILFATFQEWVPTELEAGDAWGGYLLAAYGAARFAFEAPTGAISDRVERRLGLLVGFALMLPAILLMATVHDRHAYLAFAAMLGFATAFLWPATYAMSADLYALDRRGKVIGFLNLAQLLGFGVGALAGASSSPARPARSLSSPGWRSRPRSARACSGCRTTAMADCFACSLRAIGLACERCTHGASPP